MTYQSKSVRVMQVQNNIPRHFLHQLNRVVKKTSKKSVMGSTQISVKRGSNTSTGEAGKKQKKLIHTTNYVTVFTV